MKVIFDQFLARISSEPCNEDSTKPVTCDLITQLIVRKLDRSQFNFNKPFDEISSTQNQSAASTSCVLLQQKDRLISKHGSCKQKG